MFSMRRPPLSLLVLAAGCAAAEPFVGDAMVGVPAELEVLDFAFVRFEGRRIAVEWFLLEMRERVRAAHGDPTLLPQVNVRVAGDARGVDGQWISALRTELQKAGVQQVALIP